jgi:Flp pilus assembly protein TadG
VASLELAMTVVILIAFAGACVDLGRFAYTYIAVTNACSEGASYGCMTPPTTFPDDAAWQTAIRNRAAAETTGLNPPLTANSFTAQLWQAPGCTHVCVRVTGQVPFNLLLAPWPWLPSTMTCHGLSAMPPMP